MLRAACLGGAAAVLVGVSAAQYFSSSAITTSPRQEFSATAFEALPSFEVSTRAFKLDRPYMSMTGPSDRISNLRFVTDTKAEVLWLTGIDASVVSADSMTPESPEFFCHANLTLDPKRVSPKTHNERFQNRTHMDWRFFTLVPGRMEIKLPSGFGIPVLSDTPLDFFAMSLNQNYAGGTKFVRFKSRIEFVKQSQISAPLRAVFRRALYVLEPINSAGVELLAKHPHASHPGETCGDPGAERVAMGRSASTGGFISEFGSDVTIHWMVEPGTHIFRTRVTPQIKLSTPTTIHYATAHLHPFGRSLELFDVTEQKSVVKLAARDFADRIGVEWMEELKSPTGIPIDPNREYELRAEYQNPTGSAVDAMAIMYLYLAEPAF